MASWPAALVDVHRRGNRDTAGAWARFASHRQRVTALVERAAAEVGDEGAGGPPPRLAILGAGNCNDVDLTVVAPRFGRVDLVDLDAAAVQAAAARQPGDVAARIAVRAPVDLSGALGRLSGWRHGPPTAQQLAALPRAAAEKVLAGLGGARTFEVVLSACFLSQLMRTCYVALGPRSEHLHLVAAALALGHLRALARLLAPGGIGLLVSDMTSSETYPLEETFAARGGRALLADLCVTDNVFAGTGATFVEGILREDDEAAALVEQVELLDPWLWDFSDDRSYLCYAMRFRRR